MTPPRVVERESFDGDDDERERETRLEKEGATKDDNALFRFSLCAFATTKRDALSCSLRDAFALSLYQRVPCDADYDSARSLRGLRWKQSEEQEQRKPRESLLRFRMKRAWTEIQLTGGRGGLAGSLGGELLAGGLATRRLASRLLGTSHCCFVLEGFGKVEGEEGNDLCGGERERERREEKKFGRARKRKHSDENKTKKLCFLEAKLLFRPSQKHRGSF